MSITSPDGSVTVEPDDGRGPSFFRKLTTATDWKTGLVVSLDLHMYVGADSPKDHIVIDGSPSMDMTVKGGIAGDIATAAISVNAIPKVMSARPGVLTMRDIPLLHSYNKEEARNPPKK